MRIPHDQYFQKVFPHGRYRYSPQYLYCSIWLFSVRWLGMVLPTTQPTPRRPPIVAAVLRWTSILPLLLHQPSPTHLHHHLRAIQRSSPTPIHRSRQATGSTPPTAHFMLNSSSSSIRNTSSNSTSNNTSRAAITVRAGWLSWLQSWSRYGEDSFFI